MGTQNTERERRTEGGQERKRWRKEVKARDRW